jgi:hypothetical protein
MKQSRKKWKTRRNKAAISAESFGQRVTEAV